KIACIVLVMVLAGCAGYRPIVDLKGVDSNRYEADLRECQQYAKQISPAGSGIGGALLGGLFGAALGAATGAAVGAPGRGAALGTAVGGVTGGGSAAASAAQAQQEVIKRCLAGRGYRVLH
ncbi:MAG: hypothetical protein ACE5HV_17635, partial [Acidobacteriota bacterium]